MSGIQGLDDDWMEVGFSILAISLEVVNSFENFLYEVCEEMLVFLEYILHSILSNGKSCQHT